MAELIIRFPDAPVLPNMVLMFASYLESDQDACLFISALLYLFGIVTLHLSTQEESSYIASVLHACNDLENRRVLISKELLSEALPLSNPNIEEHNPGVLGCILDSTCKQIRQAVGKHTPPIAQWRNCHLKVSYGAHILCLLACYAFQCTALASD